MGLPWFRQGEIIETATRECETRRIGVTWSKKQTSKCKRHTVRISSLNTA